MKPRIFAMALCALLAPLHAGARTIDLRDYRRVVTFGDPQLSSSGRSLIYTRTHVDYQNDRNHTDLMFMDVRSHRARHLTYDRRGVNSPRWSPDGSSLAFLALTPTGKEQQEQVFLMPLNGGDALKLTNAPEGVERFAWSPDGSRIAYVTQGEAPNKKAIDKHLDAFEVGDNNYLQTKAATPSHLWLIATHSGAKAVRLTHGSFSLSTAEPDAGSPLSWSADGRYIAFTRFKNAQYGDSLTGAAYAYDMQTHALRRLTAFSALTAEPIFAPRGPLFAYSRPTSGDPTNGTSVLVASIGANGLDVRRNLDRSVGAKIWLPDASGLLLAGDDGTQSALWLGRLNAPARRLDLGTIDLAQVGNVVHDAVAFVGTRAHHPSELFYLPTLQSKPVALTNENAFVDKLQLGEVRSLTWRGPNGFTEDGVLTYPPGFQSGKKYPLVVMIHGGPQSATTAGWGVSRRQIFASHGYLIFEPNYRGSTNLGDRYQHAIYRDAGQGPGEDVMAGIAAVKRLGIVDASRIAVCGWSYGGFMTSWLEGHYGIWKAAVAGAALNDWYDDYNVSFYVNTDTPWFGGSPWNAKYSNMWVEQSPITYAMQIKTPTLIMGDTGDPNVTITNSYKMYHALKDNHVPVEFIAIPVHGHFPADPVRGEDVTLHWIGWLDKYLR